MLNRTEVVAELLQGRDQTLIVTGLGNAANDVAFVTEYHPRAFTMDGTMGAAVSLGLGVALASPNQEVLVVTGDGELLMNASSLATVALMQPSNLKILVLDNGLYGLTGGQTTATHSVADIEQIAQGCGITNTFTAKEQADLASAKQTLFSASAPSLVVVKVAPGLGAHVAIERDGTKLRDAFRNYVLQAKGE